MDGSNIIEQKIGLNQRGVRDHNERLILSILSRDRAVPAADIARQTGLSRPTVSTILRGLEEDGLVKRGDPIKGRIGKPSIPIKLNEDGVLSVGMKVGRRSAELLLLDFVGNLRGHVFTTYDYPMPSPVFGFLKDGLEKLFKDLTPSQMERVCGIGIGTPFELWKWHDLSGPAAEKFRSWKNVDFEAEVANFSDLPVIVVNDSTAACQAEHLFGLGRKTQDYAYFFIGSFIGGGVVMNGAVFEGSQGNAGALGSMRTTGPLGESQQLIDTASLHLLETRLIEASIDPQILWKKPQDWDTLERHVDPWIGATAQELAKASLSICSVIDFSTVIIDGAFPDVVKEKLVKRVRRYLVNQDKRGLIAPRIEAGVVGGNAREVGAASSPIFSHFLLGRNSNP